MIKLGDFNGVDSFETQQNNKVGIVPSVTENDCKKLDYINKSRTTESNSSKLKEELDPNIGKML